MAEKKIKIKLDIDELQNQIVLVNQILNRSLSDANIGQSAYNQTLSSTNRLLQDQYNLLSNISQTLQNNQNNTGFGGGGGSSNVNYLDAISEVKDSIGELLNPLLDIQNDVKGIFNNLSGNQVTPTGGNAGAAAGGAAGGAIGGTVGAAASDGSGGGRNVGSRVQAVSSTAAGLAVQKNEVYMAAAAASMIPFVGQGVSTVLQRLIQAGDQLSSAQGLFYGAAGKSGLGGSFSNIGLSDAQALQKAVAYRKSNVDTGISSQNFYLEKGLSLDQGTVVELSKSLRGSTMGWSAGQAGNYLLGQLQGKGGIKDVATRGYAEEYLQTLVELNREQLLVSGEVQDVLNTQVLSSIASLGREFRNPEVLQFVTQSLRSGLKQAATPQVEALQFSTLSQISQSGGNVSLWELEKMRQNPFTSRYLPEFLKNIVNISGGGEEAYFNIASIFPQLKGSPELIEKIVRKVKEGTFEQEFGIAKGGVGYNLAAEAARATAPMQRLTAETENLIAPLGVKTISGMTKMMEWLQEGLKYIDGDFSKDMSSALQTLTDIKDAISHPVDAAGSAISNVWNSITGNDDKPAKTK